MRRALAIALLLLLAPPTHAFPAAKGGGRPGIPAAERARLGGEIWFAAERERMETMAVRADGTGLRVVDGDDVLANLARGGGFARMAIDARGRFAVLESDRASFRDLWRFDLRTGAATRLTDDPAGNFEPALSPDGKRIVFASSRDGNAEIYVMDAAGGAARRLTFFHRDDWSPTWSPDGKRIAFVSDREGTPRI